MAQPASNIDSERLRCEIRKEYAEVATHPEKGLHFNTGRPLAEMLGYVDAWLDGIPEAAVESFAGTGNPFVLGEIRSGERVLDVGSGAGMDSLIAAHLVGPTGQVIGVDMTTEMLAKARKAAITAGMRNVEFRPGYAEVLPVPNEWADVVISNGAVNLCPDKSAVFRELYRALRSGGRLQIGDLAVTTPVPEDAKRDIALWTG